MPEVNSYVMFLTIVLQYKLMYCRNTVLCILNVSCRYGKQIRSCEGAFTQLTKLAKLWLVHSQIIVLSHSVFGSWRLWLSPQCHADKLKINTTYYYNETVFARDTHVVLA